MFDDSRELSVQTWTHPKYGWIVVPLEVYGDIILDMVIDTWSPRSSISRRIYVRLERLGLCFPATPTTYALRDLRLARRGIPDLEVQISRRVSMVGADGALGLDFLTQFREVRFNVESLRLTLMS